MKSLPFIAALTLLLAGCSSAPVPEDYCAPFSAAHEPEAGRPAGLGTVPTSARSTEPAEDCGSLTR